MLKKSRQFVWSEDSKNSFNELKIALSSAPVLHNPDFSRPFSIQCDASKYGIGAVLVQRTDDLDEVPIAFMSHKLTTAQANYSVSEQECLAAVMAVKKFRAYVEGQEFEIITDHASLKWLMKQTDLHGRLARWALKLQGFNFKICHRKGSQNIVPDSLSRMYAENNEEFVILTHNTTFMEEIENSLEIDLTSQAFKSKEYLDLMDKINSNLKHFPDLKIVDDFVYRRCEHATGQEIQEKLSWKLWVPSDLTQDLVQRAHDHPLCSHGGLGKTLNRLKTFFYWPRMAKQVAEYVKACEICKQTKAPNQCLRPPMGQQAT